MWELTFAKTISNTLGDNTWPGGCTSPAARLACEDRIGTGPPRARTEVICVDLGYWAVSGIILGLLVVHLLQHVSLLVCRQVLHPLGIHLRGSEEGSYLGS